MSDESKETADENSFRQEMRERREQARKRQAELAQEQRLEQKQLHWMRCPKCGDELNEVEFRSVKVDKCFGCGGVYLDDGELEQLAGRAGWLEKMLSLIRG